MRQRANKPGIGTIAIALLLTGVFLAGSPDRLRARGREYQLREDNLAVTLETTWAGAGQGGYYPLRMRIVNTGPSRTLDVRLEPPGQEPGPLVVHRNLRIDQNATLELTLPVPMVSPASSGVFRIEEQGNALIETAVRLPEFDPQPAPRPAFLVISPNHVDPSGFNEAALRLGQQFTTSFTSNVDFEQVGPTLLPDDWISYSGLDLVAISLRTLDGLPRSKRAAILKWVDCGGTLLVYGVGGSPGESADLHRLLELDESAPASGAWKPADRQTLRNIPERDPDSSGVYYRALSNTIGSAAQQVSGSPQEEPPADNRESWPDSPAPYYHRPQMLGLMVAFRDNPFPGTARNWIWLFQTIGSGRYVWTDRLGLSARTESEDFLDFLIPNVRGIPVYSFITLMTLFSIVIGPLNYLFLKRRRRLALLVVTIPLLAFVTSVSLFAYSIVVHGFGVKSRARSLTIVDQRQNTAVGCGRIALFAGMAPSQGLRYSPETAVFPLWPENEEFDTGTVDWTEGQALQSGWLRSRTRTQFFVVSHRPERQRLEIGTARNGKLSVSNGFQWHIEGLLVTDENGAVYFGRNLAPGAAARLMPPGEEELEKFKELLQRHPLESPESAPAEMIDVGQLFPGRPRPWDNFAGAAQYSMNMMESRLAELVKGDLPDHPAGGARRTYVAVFRQNPGLELGIPETDEQIGQHVLIGYY